MKAISINLLGDRPGSKLPLGGSLNLDPSLLIVAGLGLIAAFALPGVAGWAIDSFMIQPTQQHIDAIKQSIGQNKGKATQINALQKQAEALEADYGTLLALAKQTNAWREVLEETRDLVPTDMWLTNLSIDSGSHLHLEGVALDYRAVAFFYTNLQNATSFSNPILGGLQAAENNGQALVNFSVDCTLHPGTGG